jgi:FtsP/CotA-like multicopper oxidase with cupredoxin domain
MTNHATARRRATLLGIATLWAALLAAPAAAHTVYLRAAAFSATMPDGTTVIPMWGYSIGGSAEEAAAAAPTSPGPAITVPAGDGGLTVILINALPVPTSFVLHGQNTRMSPVFTRIDDGTTCMPGASLACRVRSFTHEAAPASSAEYVYKNVKPGTYFYQSGTLPQVQVQMGLVGMLRKDAPPPSTPGTPPASQYAYDNLPYDHEVAMVLSEVDPALHNAVATAGGNLPPDTSALNYAPTYFRLHRYLSTANGATAEEITSTPSGVPVTVPSGQRMLLRALNAGLQSRSLMIDDGHFYVVAEDGNKYPYPREQYSALLPAAKTADIWFTPVAGATPRVLTVFDRRLDLANVGSAVGGMLAQLKVMNFAGGPSISLPGCLTSGTQGTPYLGCSAVGTGGTAPLVLSLDAAPVGMTLNAATGAIAWTPTNAQAQRDANPTVVNTIIARATDANGVWATARVDVTVANVNDPPVAINDSAAVATGANVVAIDVAANDLDPDGNLKDAAGNLLNANLTITAPVGTAATGPAACDASIADPGSLGVSTVNGKTLVEYTRPLVNPLNCLNANGGTVTFTYQVSDSLGLASNPATVTVTVQPR